MFQALYLPLLVELSLYNDVWSTLTTYLSFVTLCYILKESTVCKSDITLWPGHYVIVIALALMICLIL